ncbi:hypothetical protein AAVH_30124 [Aphelenchoides avenae]|nr:hypothetical protein AAVH_30124 [Aphelenchus avenae]
MTEARRLKAAAKKLPRPTPKAIINGFMSKNQNRRSQLLKAVNPMRSAVSVQRTATKKAAWQGQQCYRVGDIVGVNDSQTSKKFFAQITHILTDLHAEHLAAVTWLIPKEAGNHTFDPYEFVHGVAEERPVPLRCCEYVMACPMLPRYMRPWTPEQQQREQAREELVERVAEIRREERTVHPTLDEPARTPPA